MDDFDKTLEEEKLHFAVQEGDFEQVKILLQNNEEINKFDELGKTPLHYAVENEFLDIAKFLLDNGANVNAQDISIAGNTPLANIAQNCSYKIAKLLLDYRADPTIPGWMNQSALDRAIKRKKDEGVKVYKLLLSVVKHPNGRAL